MKNDMMGAVKPGDSMEALDWAALKDNCAGDDSLVNEVIELFQREGPVLLDDVRKAVGSGDAGAIKRTAHRLKGALVSLAANPALEHAVTLERMGGEGHVAMAGEIFKQLEAEHERLMRAVVFRRS